MEDALRRLDKLTQEEARMAIAEHLRIISVVGVNDRVQVIDKDTEVIRSEQPIFSSATSGASCILSGTQMQDSLLKWLSPPDPSLNHNMACKARREGTCNWFLQSRTFEEWKSKGSLLWIYGIRISVFFLPSRLDYSRFPGFTAGSGKSVLWFVFLDYYCSREFTSAQFRSHRGDQSYARSSTAAPNGLFLF